MYNPETHWNKLQRKRGFLFRVSLIISLSLVILAFSWTTYDLLQQNSQEEEAVHSYNDIEIIPATIIRNNLKTPSNVKPNGQLAKITTQYEPGLSDDHGKINNLHQIIDSIYASFNPIPDELIEGAFVPFIPFPEIPPQFPGGPTALNNFLKQAPYCDDAARRGISGNMIVSFLVNEKGKVSNITPEKHLAPCIDAEVINYLKTMPQWEPAVHSYQKVKSITRVKLNFKLIE